jgi:hypothetical protein
MTKRSLSEAANDILRSQATSNQDKFGVGKGNLPSNPEDMGGADPIDKIAGGYEYDPENSGVAKADDAGPRAKPPGKVGLDKGELKRFANPKAKTPKEVSGEGDWDEGAASERDLSEEPVDEEVVEEEAIDEEDGGHSKFETDTSKSDGEYDGEELDSEAGDQKIPDAEPVSDQVKSYFKDKKAISSFNVKEDIDAIFSGESLSEDFKAKASKIYEAAVIAAATEASVEICESIEEQYADYLDVISEEIRSSLSEQVDDYLNYMVEEWVKENEVAVESGIKSELTEDFINGLKSLFAEHYIDIPNDKVDVVEELAAEVNELNTKLNEEISRSVEARKELNEYRKLEALHEACDGLTETQADKLCSLAESVEFTSPEEFTENVMTLRESYYPSKTPVKKIQQLDEESVEGDERGVLDESDEMNIYAKAISKTRNA